MYVSQSYGHRRAKENKDERGKMKNLVIGFLFLMATQTHAAPIQLKSMDCVASNGVTFTTEATLANGIMLSTQWGTLKKIFFATIDGKTSSTNYMISLTNEDDELAYFMDLSITGNRSEEQYATGKILYPAQTENANDIPLAAVQCKVQLR